MFEENEYHYLHVDIDMFFAAVEVIKDPSLKDIPFVVGKAMVCTANYVARKFGIRSAMPGFIAKKLCPELKFTEIDSELYK